jgi:hypothetical protein
MQVATTRSNTRRPLRFRGSARVGRARTTVFGDTFCAPVSIMPLWSSPVILDLIDRVDDARLKR